MRWLPETEDRPIRPDLPWLRNFSWTKAHAMQIGLGTALLAWWGKQNDRGGLAFGFALFVAQQALSRHQKHSERSTCNHTVGVHDLQHKPWYALTAALVTWGVAELLAG